MEIEKVTSDIATIVKAEMDVERGSGRLYFSNGNIQALKTPHDADKAQFVADIVAGELDWFQDYETDTAEQIAQYDEENPDNVVVYEA